MENLNGLRARLQTRTKELLNRTRSHLHLEERRRRERILTNSSPYDVKSLIYTTDTTHFDYLEDGDVVVSQMPSYRIDGLPSGCSVLLEKINPHLDGSPWFKIEEVEWSDGLREESTPIIAMSTFLIGLAMSNLHEDRLRVRQEMVPITRHLDIEPVFLGAKGSSYIQVKEPPEAD